MKIVCEDCATGILNCGLTRSRGHYLYCLTCGMKFKFAKLPNNDCTAVLLNNLKNGGFVAKDTELCHFRVLFGIPLHESETPFKPIRWLKNKQLLKFFATELFDDNVLREFKRLFADRYNKPAKFPNRDISRLLYSADYEPLRHIVEKFKKGI